MIKKFSVLVSAFLAVSIVSGGLAQAKLEEIPTCESKTGQGLEIDNQRVLVLKQKTPNQFQERARVKGQVVRLLQSRPSHAHFEIQIGSSAAETLEVVFNKDFGRPEVKVGDRVEACGDYITSNAPTPRYKPSPAGAIIHWVHENSRGGPHPHGYIVVNERFLFGFGRHSYEVQPVETPEVSKPAPQNHSLTKETKGRSQRRRTQEEKEERKPRHNRNWRDWQDAFQ